MDVCPWCGQWESHQVGTETPERVVVWCRSCSGSSFLYRLADFLVARTPPKWLHDKRRPRERQREPRLQNSQDATVPRAVSRETRRRAG